MLVPLTKAISVALVAVLPREGVGLNLKPTQATQPTPRVVEGTKWMLGSRVTTKHGVEGNIVDKAGDFKGKLFVHIPLAGGYYKQVVKNSPEDLVVQLDGGKVVRHMRGKPDQLTITCP